MFIILSTCRFARAYSADEWNSLTIFFDVVLVLFSRPILFSVSAIKDTRSRFKQTVFHVRYVLDVLIDIFAIHAFEVLRLVK